MPDKTPKPTRDAKTPCEAENGEVQGTLRRDVTADEQITLEQFKDVCSRLFPGVPVEKAPPREPFPDKVIYDCPVDDTLHLRFCFADKYMDNHVIILGYEPPRRSPIWDVYVYTEERLLLELEFVVGARKRN